MLPKDYNHLQRQHNNRRPRYRGDYKSFIASRKFDMTPHVSHNIPLNPFPPFYFLSNPASFQPQMSSPIFYPQNFFIDHQNSSYQFPQTPTFFNPDIFHSPPSQYFYNTQLNLSSPSSSISLDIPSYNEQKYWNNGNNAPDSATDHSSFHRDQSPQFVGSPNGNGQYNAPQHASGSGDHGGRKSANGNVHGFPSLGGDSGSFLQVQAPIHAPHQYNNGNGGGHSMNGRGESGRRDYEISTTNLYICGLKPETTDEDLMTLCLPYGPITTTKAILDRLTNKCRGFGFVDFEHPSSAEQALKNLKYQGVQAQMARCSEAKRNKINVVNTPSEHDPTNLYIANLPPQMNEKDLEAMLSAYGLVTSTRILKDTHGISRCVGFARMETRDMCDHIISLFKDKVLPGCNESLMVKYADGGAKKKNFKNSGPRYQNDDSQRSMNDSGSMATNGVSQMLPNQLNGAAGFPNMASFNPFMNLGMGIHPVPGSQYQQGAPNNGQQLYGAAAAAAQMYGQIPADPNAMQMHLHNLMGQMSQLNLNNYSYGQPYMYGMPAAPPQVQQNVENDPNVQGSLDPITGQQVGGNVDGQQGQNEGFVHAAAPPVPNQAAMTAAMIYTQSQN